MDYNSTGYLFNSSYREQGTPLRGSRWMSSVRCGLYERGELKTIVAGLCPLPSPLLSVEQVLLYYAKQLTHLYSSELWI